MEHTLSLTAAPAIPLSTLPFTSQNHVVISQNGQQQKSLSESIFSFSYSTKSKLLSWE